MSASRNSNPRRAWWRQLQTALRHPPVIELVETFSLGDQWISPHRGKWNELSHVLSGHARIQFRRRYFQVGPGDTFVVPRHTLHRDLRDPNEHYRVLYLFFRWPGAELLLEGLDARMLQRAPDSFKHHLHLMLTELQTEYLSDHADAPLHLQVQLLEILLTLVRYCHRAPTAGIKPHATVAQKQGRQLGHVVRQYLEAHYEQLITLEALALQFHTSPFHLSRSFSQTFRVSLIDVLTDIRVQHACELLRVGQLSVKEVAVRVGFADANYFAKVFRRRIGQSPTECRAAAARV